jgi:ABC-2 type transport system ATP-binding protein
VSLPPTEQPGQSVSFTSPPFTADLVSVGVPSARLRMSHAAAPRDLVFFGKVFDVAPDGSSTLIQRLIAPVRVPAGDVSAPVDLKLIGFAHRFAKGHAVRLTLASTDATSYNAKLPDAITVATGPGSTFTLPGAVTAPVGQAGPIDRSRPRGNLPATGAEPLLAASALLLLLAAGRVRRRTRY